MTDWKIDPNTGLFVNPYGTVVTPEQDERRRRAQAERVKAAIAARQRQAAELAEQRERERRERGAARLEAYRGACLGRFVANGGTEADFGRLWPEMRDRWLAEQAMRDPIAEEVARLKATGEYNV